MGFIKDGRQPFQDFSDIESRSIQARLDAVEDKFASLDAKNGRIQSQSIAGPHRSELYNLVLERLAHLESKVQNVA